MANYQSIVRLRPEVRDFIRNRRWLHRGDVVAYGPNISCASFSTDSSGFRHSTFRGNTLAMREVIHTKAYGLVLGPSSVYGFGLAGNENTMPSVLADRFGFPFANIGLPEGNSRNLHSMLQAIVTRAPCLPSAVVHISGGDFTNFCYTGIADPVFGSPNIKQVGQAIAERGGRPSSNQHMQSLLAFTSLWIRAIVELCRLRGIALILADDTTFFEKLEPSESDRESELGFARGVAQELQFTTHRQFVTAYHTRRREVAERLRVPLAGPGRTNNLGFIDEFHYDREGTVELCDQFAAAIGTLL